MNLREQEYVLAIAKHNSIKYAAEELFIAPSSLSVFLKDLEEKEGLPLFHRVGKKFYPTPAGQTYLEAAKKMALLKQSYSSNMADLKNEITGTIRFGLHYRRANYLLPKILPQFKIDYPNVKVVISELSTQEMLSQLSAGQLDLILSNQIHAQDALILQEVYQDRILLVSPKGYFSPSDCSTDLQEPYPRISLSQIANETFILQERTQTIRSYTDQVFSYENVVPRDTFVIQNLETAAKLAAAGYGLAFNFETYLKPLESSIPFDLYTVGDPSVRIMIYLAYHKNAYLPNYLHHFMDLIQENFV
ncbi:LysR family transcriptional regulator [Ihubacter sp. rT4E-8]|uniref:LysR family transcriptional regulator n=1 Tax=Ihubacter sp. rT4E-8 TaxID=3242369 RepID=UPI003CF7F7FD